MEERKNPLVHQLQITAKSLFDRVARTPAASVAGVAPSEGSAVRLGDKLSDRCVLRCFHPSLPKFSDPTLPLAVRSPLRLAQTRNLDLGALNRANSKIPLGLVLSEVVNMPSSSAELRNM